MRAQAGTLVVTRLSRGHGGWDLGIFDAKGHSLGGAAVPGAADLAQAPVRAGGRVFVQACRRPGASRTVGLTTTSVPFGGSRRARLLALRPDKDDRLLAAAVRARHRSIAVTAATRLPSGRRGYRQLPDYEADMEQLAATHPHTVREIVLPHPTLIGRRVVGVEIARDVHRSDGRPVLLVTGLHHSREWPSGEVSMEWAIDLAQRLARHDATVSRLLDHARVIVVPVVNPDGFFLSRTVRGSFEFKRKNCRIVDGQVPRPGQCEATANASLGVDPNRNYGGFWGGPGASLDPADDAYRGPAPFSEPESQNIRALIAGRQVTVALSNHTYGDLLLRPPSLRDQAPPDEAALKQLGDEIAAPAGLTSERGYELYDTSGAMEDWSYWATGGLAFTAELGDGATTDQDGLEAFHPPFAQVASWYPALRRSFQRALEWAADPAHHSVISGRGPAGRDDRAVQGVSHVDLPGARPRRAGGRAADLRRPAAQHAAHRPGRALRRSTPTRRRARPRWAARAAPPRAPRRRRCRSSRPGPPPRSPTSAPTPPMRPPPRAWTCPSRSRRATTTRRSARASPGPTRTTTSTCTCSGSSPTATRRRCPPRRRAGRRGSRPTSPPTGSTGACPPVATSRASWTTPPPTRRSAGRSASAGRPSRSPPRRSAGR